MKSSTKKQIEQLIGKIARNQNWPDDEPDRVNPPTREKKIREWISLAKEGIDLTKAMKDHFSALGYAALVVEQAKRDPYLGIKTWSENQKEIDEQVHSRAVAAWGLSIAYRALNQPVKAARYRGLGEALFETLACDAQPSELGGLAGFSDEGNPPGIPRSSQSETLSNAEPFDTWLAYQQSLTLSELWPQFGDFITNDRAFVANAKERLDALLWRLDQRLTKPFNYLLEADPGAGKSFFVDQFAAQLESRLVSNAIDGKGPRHEVAYLKKNLSSYPSIDEAFTDIVFDILIRLALRRDVVLFVDEVDTEIDGQHIFRKLIAPMNGDDFFFQQKQVSFSKQNLVVLYALSAGRELLTEKPKWPDFLSRVPDEHRFILPELNSSPLECLCRTASILLKGTAGTASITDQALLFICLRYWHTSRELDQALELAKTRVRDPKAVLQLEHVATSVEEVTAVHRNSKIDIFAREPRVLQISK